MSIGKKKNSVDQGKNAEITGSYGYRPGKLEMEIKKIEIEKMKAEQKRQQDTHHILLPSDFENISYIVKTINDLPKELRNCK